MTVFNVNSTLVALPEGFTVEDEGQWEVIKYKGFTFYTYETEAPIYTGPFVDEDGNEYVDIDAVRTYADEAWSYMTRDSGDNSFYK